MSEISRHAEAKATPLPMRWHVEVTSMDSADAQSVVVEAESWQKALHAARLARKETGPISGFSIELLDDGYRAVDPLARRRYDVKRAPDGAAVTPLASQPPPAPPAAPSMPPASMPAPAPSSTSVKPPGDEVPRPSKKPRAAPPPSKPAPAFPAKRPPSNPPSGEKIVAAAPVALPAPSATPPPPQLEPIIVPTQIVDVVASNGGADATIRTTALHIPPSGPTLDADGPIPPTQVIFKREHDPSERMPLTYREYVYTVARGVNEESGERLLRVQLDQVRASIASARPGKFVNLAVFDVVFQGKPPVPPLATLAWKDWTGDPVVSFPRRPRATQPVHAQPPGVLVAPIGAPAFTPPPPAAYSAPAVAPPPPAVPSAPQVAPPVPHSATPMAAAVVPPAPISRSAPPPPIMASNPFAASFPVAPSNPFTPGAAPLPSGVPVPLPPGVPVPGYGAPTPPPPASSHSPFSSSGPVTNAELIANAAPSQVPPPPQAPAVATFPPAVILAPAPPPQPVVQAPASFPVPAAAAPVPAPPPPPPPAPSIPRRASDAGASGANARLTPTTARASFRSFPQGRRATGDELIANLFEAMHELQFARDVIEGGDYVLALALEMIPSKIGLLHLYDIDRREYVVACVAGPGSDALLNRRFAEGEPLFAAAMRKRRALVFGDARSEESTASAERFVVLGGAVSVIVSPVLKGGRFLGVLELMNPLDAIPFTQEEGNAIDYLCEQFGEFVATRGTQLDPDRIARSVPPHELT